MPIHVQVGLLSGRAATVEADLDEEVGSLKRRAEKALGVGRGRLMDSSGSILETCTPIFRIATRRLYIQAKFKFRPIAKLLVPLLLPFLVMALS